jgi:hypothetical protein
MHRSTRSAGCRGRRRLRSGAWPAVRDGGSAGGTAVVSGLFDAIEEASTKYPEPARQLNDGRQAWFAATSLKQTYLSPMKLAGRSERLLRQSSVVSERPKVRSELAWGSTGGHRGRRQTERRQTKRCDPAPPWRDEYRGGGEPAGDPLGDPFAKPGCGRRKLGESHRSATNRLLGFPRVPSGEGATKTRNLQAFRDAGGGTRTPDTRIMIPLL